MSEAAFFEIKNPALSGKFSILHQKNRLHSNALEASSVLE